LTPDEGSDILVPRSPALAICFPLDKVAFPRTLTRGLVRV